MLIRTSAASATSISTSTAAGAERSRTWERLLPFDSHLTLAAYSALNGLTRRGSFDNFRTVQEYRKRKGVDRCSPPPTFFTSSSSDRQQDLLGSAAAGRNAQPSRSPQTHRAIPPTRRGPARRGDRRTRLDQRRTPRPRLAASGAQCFQKASRSAPSPAPSWRRDATPCWRPGRTWSRLSAAAVAAYISRASSEKS